MWVRIAGVVLVLGGLVLMGANCHQAKKPQGLDLTAPASWEVAATSEIADLDKLAEAFISVAKDEERSDEDRRKAILLVGRIGNSRCVEFLVGNIGIFLPMESRVTSAQRLMQRPCAYALRPASVRDRNWNAAPAILRELRKPTKRTKLELRNFTTVLNVVCGEKIARFLVTDELSRASNEMVKENLKTVQKYL